MIQVRRPQFVNKSKVLTMADWSLVYDARYHGGCTQDTLGTNPCKLDGDTIGYWRDWTKLGTQTATQGTAASQSAWQLDLNGEVEGVTTVGTDDTYTVPGGLAGFGEYVQGFVVANWTGTPDGVRHHIINAGAGGLLLRIGRSTEGSGELQLGLGGIGAIAVGGAAYATGISLIEFQWVRSGIAANGVKLYSNATLLQQVSYATALTTGITNWMGNGGAENWIGDAYCAYIYQSSTSLLSADTRTAIRNQFRTEFANAFSV
jgi:hypothetical protein